ncbi:MAG: PA0069 family radical SAM protein [Sphingomonadales bacterium]|nr:PA0069 family radical SAM protein [Sphingomonadales bacterium]
MQGFLVGKKGDWVRPEGRRGRGATRNPAGRYEHTAHSIFDDGWGGLDRFKDPQPTQVTELKDASIVNYVSSPDLAFERSINPYRGCEHGCIYCFARPSHAYFGLSSGLDFETRLFVKPGAADVLGKELSAEGYKPRTIAIGTNTDAYQPIERQWRVMRGILEVLDRFNHPVSILTKSNLVVRDIDILSRMAKRRLAVVSLSLTTLDQALARKMEPRASAPRLRLAAIRKLTGAGIPTGVMTAPVIPAINDHELEALLEAAYDAGARRAGYTLLRLPHEIKDLFADWLNEHFPDRAGHVLSLVRGMRGGRLNDPRFGARMHGQGAYGRMISQRFHLAARRLGFNREKLTVDLKSFARPPEPGQQLRLL